MTRSTDSSKSKSSVARSTESDTSEYVDLSYRLSLTKNTAKQREGLKRVPSCGGTTAMDMTINDEEFFGNGRLFYMVRKKWQKDVISVFNNYFHNL